LFGKYRHRRVLLGSFLDGFYVGKQNLPVYYAGHNLTPVIRMASENSGEKARSVVVISKIRHTRSRPCFRVLKKFMGKIRQKRRGQTDHRDHREKKAPLRGIANKEGYRSL
jgi:hypothetical protein